MADTWSEVHEPSTSPARLAEIAAAHPEYGQAILGHPNCYPALSEWISQYAAAGPEGARPTDNGIGDTYPARTADSSAGYPADQVSGDGGPALSPFEDRPPADPFGAQASKRSPRPMRRRWLIGSLAVVAVVAVVLGGGYWFFVGSKLGGAPSPEAAAEKLVSSIQNFDLVGLYGSFAPSEVGEVQQSIQKLSNAHPSKGGVDANKELSALRSALTITTTGMAYRTDKLADGVERVMWTKGSIKVSGSAKNIAQVESDLIDPYVTSNLKSEGLSTADITRQMSESRTSLASSIHLPTTLKASSAPLAIVAVQEGSGWYISPVLTLVDTYFRLYATSSEQVSQAAPDSKGFLDSGFAAQADSDLLGSTVVSAGHYTTPEAAAKAMVNAATQADSHSLAATMPLPERRLVSIYGPWVEKILRSNSSNSGTAYGDLSLTSAKFSSTITGDQARLHIDGLDVADSYYNSSVGENLTNRVHVQGTCANLQGENVVDNAYQDYYGNWVDNYQVVPNNWKGCFSDSGVLSRLGFSDFSLIAVKENGGWLVSPFASIGDATSIVSERVLTYYSSNRLSQLFKP